MRLRRSMAVGVVNLDEDPINRRSSDPTTVAAVQTVDQVWREVQLGGERGIMDLGDMTLEDYLEKHNAPLMDEGFLPADLMPLPVAMVIPGSNIVGGYSDAQTCGGRKRVCSVVGDENKVERKHKRMMKNRESAARSRARRKAYTNELENKILWLEEENKKLMEEQSSSPSMPTPPQETKHQLRRTSSASF